jgi:hypothetical protein
MIRRAASIAAALLLMATYTFAQERGTALGGVRFGTTPAAVATVMSDMGLAPSSLLNGRTPFPVDQTFTGTIDGHQVIVIAMYDTHDALEKMMVSFITSDAECLDFYRDFKLALTREFGETHADVEQWKAPYDDGRHVGHEATAIRTGKGFVGATWSREDLDGMAGMSLSVDGNLTVTLAYESSKWARELDRRRRVLSAGAGQ